MKLSDDPAVHLTYCLNVHAGETWEENFTAIREKACAVRDLVGGVRPFGLGMRLSREAAVRLASGDGRERLRSFLDREHLYVFTVNGFPYGRFHGRPVKQDVYAPDWRTPERVAYTNLLGDILAALLPEGLAGSISTVPCSYKAWIRSEQDVVAMTENLATCAWHLAALREKTGKTIALALEPEPDCYLESTPETVGFFERELLPRAVRFLATKGWSPPAVEDMVRRHVGVCFDTCHIALQFEDLCGSLEQLARAGIGVPKVQLSAALEVGGGAEAEASLRAFRDSVYLHQVKLCDGVGRVSSFQDLDEEVFGLVRALAEGRLRAHFHVPLYFAGSAGLGTTSALLTRPFFEKVAALGIPHLEIETYTFDVLPAGMRTEGVVASIAREYAWVLERLSPSGAWNA